MIGTKKLLFVDLDGVIFELVDHFGEYGVSPRTEDEIRLEEGLDDILNLLVGFGYTLVGVTNQPDIARGKITLEFLGVKHKRLLEKYPQFKEVFVCPHTDSDLCGCRKPKPGLFAEARRKYGANYGLSWTIGDSRSDIEAGHAVRTKTVLVQTPWNSESTVPVLGYVTAVVKSAYGAFSLILACEMNKKNKDDV